MNTHKNNAEGAQVASLTAKLNLNPGLNEG